MQKTLLIVDDEPAILAALRRLLRNSHFNLLTANSAQEALEMMQHIDVNVVLSDYQMPQMNGLELLKQIAIQWPQTQRLMLTGNNDNPDALKREAGTIAVNSNAWADEACEPETHGTAQVIHQVLSKPWSTEQLILALENTIGSAAESPLANNLAIHSQSADQTDLQNANRSLLVPQDVTELIDQQAIEQLAADVSEQMFPELASLFIETTEQRLDQLEQVDQQLQQCPISKEVRRQLHTLASAMALYGLVHCAQSARYLENAEDSEVQRHLGAFCESARQSLKAFNQRLIERTQS